MTRKDLLTTAEVAEVLRCSPDAVIRRIREGSLDAIQVGRRWLVARKTIERMLAGITGGE